MNTYHFSPSVLDWAASNIGLSWQSLADEIVTTKNKDRLRNTYNGILTNAQAKKVAQKTRIPFGFLFLDTPPKMKKPSIPDLRQMSNPPPLSIDFQDTLEDIIAKQEWYIDYLEHIDAAHALPFVGKFEFNKSLDAKMVSNDIIKTLELTLDDRKNSANTDAFYNLLSEKIENIGVLVFKNSIVKSATRRALSEKEFRGFALVNKIVPAIFINGKDAKAAWIFTLMHELCHIWLGESGVSYSKLSVKAGLEFFCNKVAAEVLVPETDFLTIWKEKSYSDDRMKDLAKYFNVSTLVIARRALDLDMIDKNEYFSEANKHYLPSPKDKGGGNPYATYPVRNSKKLTRIIIESAASGELMLRDAARLLNIQPRTIMELRKRIIARELKR